MTAEKIAVENLINKIVRNYGGSFEYEDRRGHKRLLRLCLREFASELKSRKP